MRTLRIMLPQAGFGIPAAMLRDNVVACWAASRCVTVFAGDVADLDMARARRIRPVQIVARLSGSVDHVREALSSGVARFVAPDDHDLDMLSRYAHRTTHAYLGPAAHMPSLRRRVELVGMYGVVDDAEGNDAWSATVERLMCRMALVAKCGARPRRILLAGGSAGMTVADVGAIATTIDAALRDAWDHWRLPRPAVTLIPLGLGQDVHAATAMPTAATRRTASISRA